MTRAPARDVDAYLASLPEARRAALEKLRAAIKSAAPKAEELISYRIPAYKQNGMLVFFAAFKDHCSLFPASRSILTTFSSELAPFKISGTAIHFSPEHPLPAALVKKIVKARIAQNEARAKVKPKKS